MALDTTNFGYVAYNGVKLTGPWLHVDLIQDAVLDDAKRTVAYTVFTLHVRTILTNDVAVSGGYLTYGANATAGKDPALNNARAGGGGTGGTLDNERILRAAFAQQGAALHIDAMGFYFNVGEAGTGDSGSRVTTDCMYGPVPGQLRLTPIGNYLTHQLDWTVTWHAKECLVAPATSQAANSEFSLTTTVRSAGYSLLYDMDEHGLTTRTVTGHIEIFLNRTSPAGGGNQVNTIPNIADVMRESINVDVPHGFRRARRSFGTSEDKTRLGYVIIDRELPGDNAFPIGVDDLNMKHRVSTAQGQFATTFHLRNVITGSVTAAKNWPVSDVFDRVMAIARSRIDTARIQAKKDNGLVLITSIDVGRQLFGPKVVDFDIAYLITSGKARGNNWPPGNIIGRSGVFDDVTLDVGGQSLRMDTGAWNDWHSSVFEFHDHRGYAGLRPSAAADTIIDACTQTPSRVPFDGQTILSIQEGRGALTNECPSHRDQVYRFYDSRLNVTTDPEQVRLTTIATSGNSPTLESTESSVSEDGTESQEGVPVYNETTNTSSYTYSSRPEAAIVTLWGCASRVGAWPELPNKALGILKKLSKTGSAGTTISSSQLQQVVHNRRKSTLIGGCRTYNLCWTSIWKIENIGRDIGKWNELLKELEQVLEATISDDTASKIGGNTD
jgi:hypothetical protein